MIKHVIPTLKPTGGEVIELVLENEQDVEEYALLDAARLVHSGGRWSAESVATDDEMMDPSELKRAKEARRPQARAAASDPSRVELLIDGELRDVLGEMRLRPLTAGSDDPIRAASPPYACIDHICASGEWRVRRSVRWPNLPKPPKGKLSDHFGVAVEIARGAE